MNHAFFRWVLDSLADGLIVIGGDGAMIAANPAAERLLGIDLANEIGQPFAAIFLEDESLDALVQSVVDAIGQADMTHNRLLRLEREDKPPRVLALSTSLLSDGEGQRLGVIAMLNDISEIEALRAREQALNADLKESNRALADSYSALEASNTELKTLTRRVHLVRNLATGFVILLFVAIGGYAWNLGRGDISVEAAAPPPVTASPKDSLVLKPRPHRTTVRLAGYLEPIDTVNIVAPLEGTVERRHFNYGDAVVAGQLLLTISRETALVKYREARSSYITALEEFKRLEQWDQGAEMQRARRGLSRATANLQTLIRKETETKRLLDLGIVAANELASLREQLASARMEEAQAREEIEATQAQGGEDKRTVAKLKLDNAEYAMREWERKLEQSEVRAPVDGVVMTPEKRREGGVQEVDVGSAVQEGMTTLTIGDMTGIAVRVAVDELEVRRMQPGQLVWISGEALAGMRLEGRVERVSSQASREAGRAAPTFDLLIRVPKLTPEQREMVRVGLSARLEVVLHDDPEALLVPISAVRQGAEGPYVRVREAGQERDVPVETGLTDLDSVLILSGLTPGMEILTGP